MQNYYKPAGCNTLCPYLCMVDAKKVVDFLKHIFSIEEIACYNGSDGKILHAELKLEDSMLMLCDATEEWPAFSTWIHVYVQDVDTVYQKALAAGGISIREPEENMPDPDRRCAVKDSAGNVWWITTSKSE